LLLVEFEGIVACFGGEHHAATCPVRRTGRTLPCTTCTLLPPRFAPAAAYFCAGFGTLGTLPLIGKILHNRHVQGMFVDFNGKNIIRKVDTSSLVAIHIVYSYIGHDFSFNSFLLLDRAFYHH
jgi:hypothetical protein